MKQHPIYSVLSKPEGAVENQGESASHYETVDFCSSISATHTEPQLSHLINMLNAQSITQKQTS